MTDPPRGAGTLPGKRVLFIVNMVTAVIGGLSLVGSVGAPFGMGMGEWRSFSDVMPVASVLGGLPLTCAASVVLSRWLFGGGRFLAAGAVAGAPLILVEWLLLWGAANG